MYKNKILRYPALLLALLLCLSLLTGCQKPAPSSVPETIALATTAEVPVADSAEEPSESPTPDESLMEETEEPAPSEETSDSVLVSTESVEETVLTLDPNGSYNSADEVALYIHLYGQLPSNYLTKKQAQKLGWSGGSLEPYAPGKSIGGSYFGNNEGHLPDGSYHECDIDTVGKSKRGAKRIVYSEDGNIYYTEDHYESFRLLYTADGPVTEEIIYP